MILDTSALVAVLYREPEANRFVQLIHDAKRCVISAGNFLELGLVLERSAGPEMERQRDALFRRAGIGIAPFTEEQAFVALLAFHDYGRGRHPAGLNFGDCFAYALAKVSGEPLLFKGTDFSQTDIVAAA